MEKTANELIPKKFHYFWFGNGEKPDSVLKCIESWKKYCPDFEIIEWNENNYDIHKHPFMEKAYQEKKWAFVSDYARLDVLYEHGGIYLDTDVEILKDFSPLCVNQAYIGFERPDLVNDGQELLVAKGGRGGRGNARFCTPQKRAPQFCEPGEPPIERELSLELKLIADVGLLGMPNAGKSTFISAISSAKPKIADYPFTTLVPNLGVVRKPTGDGYVVADIPGLIEGASEGIGLGYEFLRHVERCRFLVHIVDLTQDNPIENYEKINNELAKYSERLANLYQIVALNKIDAVDEEVKEKYFEKFKSKADDLFLISAATHENIESLTYFMAQKVDEIEKPVSDVVVEEDTGAYDNDDSSYEIIKASKDTYIVSGGKIKRLTGVTDDRNRQQILRLQNILKGMGVFDELRIKGIKDGDTVIIGHLEFEFYDDEY